MIQVIFIALLLVTLLAGSYINYSSSQKNLNPVKFMMDNSGYSNLQTLNLKKTQNINMRTNRGIVQIRRQIDDLALEQNKFLDSIQDQKQILKNANRDAANILQTAQKQGGRGNKDILRLEALSSEIQDEQRLLIARGQNLVFLNDQLTKKRHLIAEQIDLGKINDESSMRMLQQRYSLLNDQAVGLFDLMAQHDQDVRDRLNMIQGKLHDLANVAYIDQDQQQGVKESIQRMLGREQEDMLRLAQNEDRGRNLFLDARENISESKELLNDSLQRTKDTVQEERQRQEDQMDIIKQRIADQEQRIQDQRIQDQQVEAGSINKINP